MPYSLRYRPRTRGCSTTHIWSKTAGAAWNRSPGRVAARFYARLFVTAPELRALFPMVMEDQQLHFLRALRRVVQGLDSPLLLETYLLRLGGDHRKFAVGPEHYLPFGRALIDTLREFDPEMDERTEEAWIVTYATVADRMLTGAARQADTPAWWDAVVVDHHRPTPDIAVLKIRPSRPYPYYPGQFLSLQTPLRAQLWRTYSIANAPDPGGTLELHVRAVPGGWGQRRAGPAHLRRRRRAARAADGRHAGRPRVRPGTCSSSPAAPGSRRARR